MSDLLRLQWLTEKSRYLIGWLRAWCRRRARIRSRGRRRSLGRRWRRRRLRLCRVTAARGSGRSTTPTGTRCTRSSCAETWSGCRIRRSAVRIRRSNSPNQSKILSLERSLRLSQHQHVRHLGRGDERFYQIVPLPSLRDTLLAEDPADRDATRKDPAVPGGEDHLTFLQLHVTGSSGQCEKPVAVDLAGFNDAVDLTVRRHGAGAELRVHPVDAERDVPVEIPHAADQPVSRDDRRTGCDSLVGPRSQLEVPLGSTPGDANDLCGDKGGGKSPTKTEQLPKAAILGFDGRVADKVGGEAVTLRTEPCRIIEEDVSLDGALLEGKNWAQHTRPNAPGQPLPVDIRQQEKNNGKAEEYGRDPPLALAITVAAVCQVRSESAQVANTPRYLLTSSRIRPAPRTTQVSGSSSTCIGKFVSRAIS